MSLDIVVTNYHTPADLEQFLISLSRNPPAVPTTLTIVEVDAEETGIESYEWSGGPGETLSARGNIGYARACNMGAQRGHGDIVALFNADVEITPGALDECHRVLLAHEDWAVLGPCQVDPRNRIRHAGIFGSLEAPVHRGWNELHRGRYSDIVDAITVSGSAYFVRRSVWDELSACPLYRDVAPDAGGAFLPTPHYYEETWCSYHAHAHGHRIVYYGPVTLIHKWHQASPVGGWADQQMTTSRDIFRRACDHHGIAHE